MFSYNAKMTLAADDEASIDLATNSRFDGVVILGINSAFEDFEKFGYEIGKRLVVTG